jgi:TonB family protein
VDLDNTETKYYPYLLQVKERIDREWSYPEDSFSRGEVGTTVVEFSIARAGGLATCRAIASTGHPSLDAESLRASRSAAPFAPLPKKTDWRGSISWHNSATPSRTDRRHPGIPILWKACD